MSCINKQPPRTVYRAEREAAERWLAVVNPTLLRLTGTAGIVCRETKNEDLLFDVRAQVGPEVAQAIYTLIVGGGLGREDVTEPMIVSYLEDTVHV